MTTQIDERLLDYCNTDRQREYITATNEHGSMRKAAEAIGCHHNKISAAVKSARARAARGGYSPEHGINRPAPDGYMLRCISDMRENELGKPIWYKIDVDRQRQQEMMVEAIQAMAADLPQIAPSEAPAIEQTDLMAVYPLGDPHIGLLSWAQETGQDWDLYIAEQSFCEVFDRLVKTAPHCAEAVIINLGDYFHYDNMEGQTSRSKHSLDVDGRYAKMVQVGVKIIRQMITSALEIHQRVRVINAVGNHDDTGALFLSVCLDHIYENEPRVVVDITPAPFHYVQHGKTMFGVHHGHTCKPANLPGVMASDQAKMWGETTHRYWYTGHIHHDTKKEFPGVTQESFRTLAAKDAYATWGGYRSGQDSKCIVLHKLHGEVERHTVNISQIMGAA
jgi:hypothetical protein